MQKGDATIKPGTRFVGNGGYTGTVIEPAPGTPGSYHVRYPGGLVCQSASEILGCINGTISDVRSSGVDA